MLELRQAKFMSQEQESSQSEYDYSSNLTQQELDNLLADEQISDFRQALLLFQQGEGLAEKEEFDAAIVCYEKALEVKPDYYWAWAGRGNALEKLNRYEEAIVCYDKAVEIQPDSYWIWNERGDILEKLNRYEDAIASYDKALEIKPDSYWAWYKRAGILNQLGRSEEAVLHYDKLVEQTSHINSSLDWHKRRIITTHHKLLPYLTNRWARGRRTFWGNLRLIYLTFQFPIILCTTLALIVFSKGTPLAEILTGAILVLFTGFSIIIIPTTIAFEFKNNIKLVYKIYFKSGLLTYIRGFFTVLITILCGVTIYLHSPDILRFGWGQIVFSNSGNIGITQPFKVAEQVAKIANSTQETPAPKMQADINTSSSISKKFDYRWIFIPALWLLLVLVLPFWAKAEEEAYRQGVHTWKGITINSIKFGLSHLIMGIPICIGLSLSVTGFLFACRYKYAYHQHLSKFGNEQKAQETGVFASTADHTIYNVIIITWLTASFLF
jgi:tetratricopeptide (TPR) repeat protein